METAAQIINVGDRDLVEVQFKDDFGRSACIRLNPQTFLDGAEAVEICQLLNQLGDFSSVEGLGPGEFLRWTPREESMEKMAFRLSDGSFVHRAIEDCEAQARRAVAYCSVWCDSDNEKQSDEGPSNEGQSDEGQPYTLEELRAVLRGKVRVVDNWLGTAKKCPAQPKEELRGGLGPDDDCR